MTGKMKSHEAQQKLPRKEIHGTSPKKLRRAIPRFLVIFGGMTCSLGGYTFYSADIYCLSRKQRCESQSGRTHSTRLGVVGNCGNHTNSHRCVGERGGIPDFVAWDLVEAFMMSCPYRYRYNVDNCLFGTKPENRTGMIVRTVSVATRKEQSSTQISTNFYLSLRPNLLVQ